MSKLLIAAFAFLLLSWPSYFCLGQVKPAKLTAESLLLSPGDLISVSVFDVPELEKHVRITDRGSITLPLVGEMTVAGLTPAEAEHKVRDALASGRFIRNAQVNIGVDQYAAADIAVSGQVQHPGSYPSTIPRNLMDILSMAGGLTPAADTHVTVQRRGAHGETLQASLVNDPSAAMKNSLLVYPGDLVIVPKAGIVYVLGDVVHPGGYVMVNDAQLTLMQAISLAAGTTKTASEAHARLLRNSVSGPVEIPVCLKCLEKGTEPDIELKAEDVVYIPYSTTKNIMLGASSILSSTGGAAVYAVH
jgi:polysaccharide export outer membrane protein